MTKEEIHALATAYKEETVEPSAYLLAEYAYKDFRAGVEATLKLLKAWAVANKRTMCNDTFDLSFVELTELKEYLEGKR